MGAGATITAIARDRDECRRIGDTRKISGRAISSPTTPRMEDFDA